MKVVIDTNVFVSSFFGGNPRKVIDIWRNGKITLCMSKDIVNEYVEVLQKLGLENESELKELLHLFAKGYNLIFTTKTPKIKAVKDDPGDDKFIARKIFFNTARCCRSRLPRGRYRLAPRSRSPSLLLWAG